MRLYALEELHLGQQLLVAGLAVLFGLLYALVHGIHVSEYQLYIYGFHIADGVYRAVHVDYVLVLEAAHYVNYGVHLPYMGKELVAKTLAPVCAAHKARYIHELYCGGGVFFGVVHFGKHVQAAVRHRYHAHVGLYGTEGVIGGLCPRLGYGIEKCAFAYVRKSYYSELHMLCPLPTVNLLGYVPAGT